MLTRIVADDLSGAAECAAAFAGTAGGEVPVYLSDTCRAAGPCCVLDTDSRAMDAPAASLAAVRAMQWATSSRDRVLVFKKIDSTLRGQIATELVAALAAQPSFDGVIVAPANPEQNRELRGGKLHVDGHPFPPSDPIDLVGMLAAAGLRPALLQASDGDAGALALRIADALRSGARAVAVDAGSAADLACIAEAIDRQAPSRVLVAGSAGLTRALANAAAWSSSTAVPETPRTTAPGRGPVVAIVGSFSPRSVAQVRNVAVHGCAEIVRCPPDQWLDARGAGVRDRALRLAEASFAAGRNVLFTIGGAPSVTHGSRALVQSIAAAVTPLLQNVAGLVLTGGETARMTLECLGAGQLDVFGEFEPGISMSRIAARPEVRIFIKAGAFGDEMTLCRLLAPRETGPSVPATAASSSHEDVKSNR